MKNLSSFPPDKILIWLHVVIYSAIQRLALSHHLVLRLVLLVSQPHCMTVKQRYFGLLFRKLLAHFELFFPLMIIICDLKMPAHVLSWFFRASWRGY